jgi:hypothetical protein
MFNKVAAFRMLPPRRPAPSVSAPANDNRRNAPACASERTRSPRLVCRWSLAENTGRPVCRWELDNADEPNPPLRDGSQHSRPIHKTVFQLSYQGETAGAAFARHPAWARARRSAPAVKIRTFAGCCTHVTRRCDLLRLPVRLLPIVLGLP